MFKGGPTQQGREGRTAESKWLQERHRVHELRGKFHDTLKMVEGIREQVTDSAEIWGNVDSLREYLSQVEDLKNVVRDNTEDVRELLAQNDTLSTELGILDVYATRTLKDVEREISGRISELEKHQRAHQSDVPDPVRPPEEALKPSMDLETYEQNVWRLIDEVMMIGSLLRAKGNNPAVREEMLGRLRDSVRQLKALDAQAGKPDSQVRKDAERVIRELGSRWKELIPKEPYMPPPRPPKGSTFAAWLPRAPEPPYRARLAAMAVQSSPVPAPAMPRNKPALPELPANWDSLPDAERIAALEKLLSAFVGEYRGIMDRYDMILKDLIARAKARKIEELKGKVSTTS